MTDCKRVETALKRLGLCEVCNFNPAKYTCPKCEVKTCRLECLNIHKVELECNGIQDKTKFIPIKEMTENDFMSDYCFLEECTRYTNTRKHDQIKRATRYNKMLPTHLFKLRSAAHERGVQLRFLLQNFTKHKNNTTFYDWNLKVIHWRIDWIFIHAQNALVADERADENEKLATVLGHHIKTHSDSVNKLAFYESKGMNGLTILLKAEGVKRCANRYYELDVSKSLKVNLRNKVIVEYPVIMVIYNDLRSEFDIIEDEEEEQLQAQRFRDEIYQMQSACRKSLEQNAIEPRAKKLKAKKDPNQPRNFMFDDDFSSDTEEEETK